MDGKDPYQRQAGVPRDGGIRVSVSSTSEVLYLMASSCTMIECD